MLSRKRLRVELVGKFAGLSSASRGSSFRIFAGNSELSVSCKHSSINMANLRT